MRRFKLINAEGAEWDLMQRDGYYNEPDGYGYDRSFKSIRAGYDYLQISDVLDQKAPSGELVFRTYAQYQAFVAFAAKDDPLYLCYAPMGTWYRCRCKVQELGKSEMSSPGLLICRIKFICFGAWSEQITATQSTVDTSHGKIYPYTYPYTYADTTIAIATLQNGALESPCRLNIFGPVENPTWTLVQNGVSLMTGRVNVTIPAGNKLVVDATPSNMEITEYTTDNQYVGNRYAESDFSTARFVYAPPGESTLTVTNETGADVAVAVEMERVAYAV